MRGFRIRGVGGITWGFGTMQSSPLRLVKDPVGVMGAGMKNEFISSVSQDGATYNGTSHGQVEWSIQVQTKGTGHLTAAEMVTLAATWRRSLGCGEELLTLEVDSEGGGIRTQTVRLNQALPELNLDQLQNAKYFTEEVKLISESSWFTKPDLEYTFTNTELSTAKISNPADRPAPLVYDITGPMTSPTLGIGETVTLTGLVIPAGQTWRFQTDKARVSIVNLADNTNKMRTAYMARGQSPFVWTKYAEAGAIDAALTLAGSSMSSATRVKVKVPQRYRMGVG